MVLVWLLLKMQFRRINPHFVSSKSCGVTEFGFGTNALSGFIGFIPFRGSRLVPVVSELRRIFYLGNFPLQRWSRIRLTPHSLLRSLFPVTRRLLARQKQRSTTVRLETKHKKTRRVSGLDRETA
jgi:hypothetical protein